MLQDEAILAIHNCGVRRSVAEALVLNANEERLQEALTSPSWALFNYWKESMSPNIREQACETGAQLAAALDIFGFREEIVRKVQKNKSFGHLSARGWARHIALEVHNAMRVALPHIDPAVLF